MELADFLDHVKRGALIEGGSEQHAFMLRAAQEALHVIAELNAGYREPEEVRALLSRLTGREVAESVTVFPPFYSEFGKNLALGEGVFINMGCTFQDTGGITIGDGTLIGHGSTLTTLNHDLDPERRGGGVAAGRGAARGGAGARRGCGGAGGGGGGGGGGRARSRRRRGGGGGAGPPAAVVTR